MNSVLEHTAADRRLQAADGPNRDGSGGQADLAARFCREMAALRAQAAVEHIHASIEINAIQQRELRELRAENTELRGRVQHLLGSLAGLWNVRNMLWVRHRISRVMEQYNADLREWMGAAPMPEAGTEWDEAREGDAV